MSPMLNSSTKNKSIAVLITCHNRKDKTLACLNSILHDQYLIGINLKIFLVDDGSTDATGNAVCSNFPEVIVLQGDGTLYWNGGMRLAYKIAKKEGYDYYLWLNDDVKLYPNAIAKLIDTSVSIKKNTTPSIIVGSMQDPETGNLTYSGNRKKNWYSPLSYKRIEPKNFPVPCDAINGNCVLIPHAIAEMVGNLSKEFTHGAGDYDYSLRAKKLGFTSYVAPGYFGTCKQNTIAGSCQDKSLPLKVRGRIITRPTALPPAKEWMLFARRHAGLLWPFYWARTYVRICFPKLWLILRSKNSKEN